MLIFRLFFVDVPFWQRAPKSLPDLYLYLAWRSKIFVSVETLVVGTYPPFNPAIHHAVKPPHESTTLTVIKSVAKTIIL